MGAVGRRRREHGRGERCGLADGADGEGRSDGDGEGVISGVGIAAGKRRGAVRKKMTGKAETLFFAAEFGHS